MAGTRDIQRRSKSVKSISKVTQAMEAVSASKMRRAQQATLRSRAYALKAAEIMAHLRAQPSSGHVLHPLLQDHPEGRPAVILITPDRGLTGGLVLNIIRYGLRTAKDTFGGNVSWIALGKKGRDFMARSTQPLVAEFTPVPDNPGVLDVSPVARIALDGFLGHEFSSVHLVYADFVSVSKQRPIIQPLLPIVVPDDVPTMRSNFTFEPDAREVLDTVLPRLAELRIYQALLEAQASEHSARMVAMRNATDAANELVDSLNLQYNKARQSDITNEILDIAGGAEALRKAMA